MRELPLACSLDGPALAERLVEMRAIGRDALVAAEPAGASTHVLRFRPGEETRARLERIVAAEARCCPFLSMHLDDDADSLRLTLAAPPGVEPVVAGLIEAFAAPAAP